MILNANYSLNYDYFPEISNNHMKIMNTKLIQKLSIVDALHLPGVVIFLNKNISFIFRNPRQHKLVPPQWMSEIGIEWLFWLLNAPEKLWKQ